MGIEQAAVTMMVNNVVSTKINGDNIEASNIGI